VTVKVTVMKLDVSGDVCVDNVVCRFSLLLLLSHEWSSQTASTGAITQWTWRQSHVSSISGR